MQAAKAVSDGPTDDAKQCLQRFAPKIARFIQKWERWQSCFKFGSIKRQTYYSLCASKQDKMTTGCKKCWSIHTCNFKIVDRVVLVFQYKQKHKSAQTFHSCEKNKNTRLGVSSFWYQQRILPSRRTSAEGNFRRSEAEKEYVWTISDSKWLAQISCRIQHLLKDWLRRSIQLGRRQTGSQRVRNCSSTC